MSPAMFPDGGGDDITSAELTAYVGGHATDYVPETQTFFPRGGGGQTPQEVEVIDHTEEKFDAIVTGWVDSGGPGGFQQAVSHEILRRAALLQGNVNRSVRHWAKPGRERALNEMLSVLVAAIADRDRLLLELRERMNASGLM